MNREIRSRHSVPEQLAGNRSLDSSAKRIAGLTEQTVVMVRKPGRFDKQQHVVCRGPEGYLLTRSVVLKYCRDVLQLEARPRHHRPFSYSGRKGLVAHR